MSWRRRLTFLGACLLAFALLAAFISWSTSSTGPPNKAQATVTQAPGATRPTGLAVVDLRSAEQLQARFNAGKGVPRLVLALAPT